MINRSAVVLHPKQPFLDWAASLDDSGIVPSAEDERTVYLLPEYEEDVNGELALADAWSVLFEAELENWHLVEADWPDSRSLEMFRAWFAVTWHSVVEDLVDGPLIDEP